MQKFSPAAAYFKLLSNRFTQFCFFISTLIFARHLFSYVHIFAAYNFVPEVPFFNFRLVVFFVILCRHPLEVISAPIYKLINIVRNLTCWHAYLLHFRVYIFVDGNFRFFSGRENYNRAKINFLNIVIIKHSLQ